MLWLNSVLMLDPMVFNRLFVSSNVENTIWRVAYLPSEIFPTQAMQN